MINRKIFCKSGPQSCPSASKVTTLWHYTNLFIIIIIIIIWSSVDMFPREFKN